MPYKLFDLMVKVGFILMTISLVLDYSVQQKHTATESVLVEQHIGKYIETQKVITDSNNTIVNVISERQLTMLIALKLLIKGTLLLTLLGCLAVHLAGYPRRQGLFSLTVMMIGFAISNASFNHVELVPTKNFSINIGLMIALVCLYFLLRNKFNKTVANSQALLVFASQSGSAYNLAKTFKNRLPHRLDLKCISHITPQCIAQYQQVLFIASTYGQGQPPDKAHHFLKNLAKTVTFKQPLSYAVLALGDSSYQHYCAFGHQLGKLFSDRGATPISTTVEVDKLDNQAINHWWHSITSSLGWEKTTIAQAPFHQLTVNQQLCVNKGSLHRQAFHIAIARNGLEYQSGDLLEILPKQNQAQCESRLNALAISSKELVTHAGKKKTILAALMESEWCQTTVNQAQTLAHNLTPLTSRVYSIMSANHQQNSIEIFVRRCIRSDGSPGIASNYLAECSPNAQLTARIKKHPNFHIDKGNAPLILIGAGTGIAPLISFIRQAAANTVKREIWLFFGEQHQATDFYFQQEINAFVANNTITKLTTAWSRDSTKQYVHHAMVEQQQQLKQWLVKHKAQVYLCGNQSGFGNSTLTALKDIITQPQFDLLEQEHRLHVDLY